MYVVPPRKCYVSKMSDVVTNSAQTTPTHYAWKEDPVIQYGG